VFYRHAWLRDCPTDRTVGRAAGRLIEPASSGHVLLVVVVVVGWVAFRRRICMQMNWNWSHAALAAYSSARRAYCIFST